MIWSFSLNNATSQSLVDELNAAADKQISQISLGGIGESIEQIHAAVSAAIALTPTLGSSPWLIQLSGHANPKHEQRPGWSQDYIQIRIEQVKQGVPIS